MAQPTPSLYALDPALPVLMRPDGAVQLGWSPRRAVLIQPPRGVTAAGLAASGSEARRKIAEGAVRIDGEKVLDAATQLTVGETHILQLGPRRFARVALEKK